MKKKRAHNEHGPSHVTPAGRGVFYDLGFDEAEARVLEMRALEPVLRYPDRRRPPHFRLLRHRMRSSAGAATRRTPPLRAGDTDSPGRRSCMIKHP